MNVENEKLLTLVEELQTENEQQKRKIADLSGSQKSLNAENEKLLTVMEELQTENEQQKQKIADLNGSQKSLNAENEKLLTVVEELEQENEKLKQHRQTIEPLIQTVRQQEQLLTGLKGRVNSLNAENEKLLKLAEQEKQLLSDNSKLKKYASSLKIELDNAKREIDGLKAAADKLQGLVPKKADIQDFADTLHHARKSAENINALNYANMAVMLIFAAVTVFTGWQLWSTRDDVKSLSTGVERVRQGVYNSNGWSVLEGTMMNEWMYSQEHPESYQKYLERKNAEK